MGLKNKNDAQPGKRPYRRLSLVLYDAILLIMASLVMMFVYVKIVKRSNVEASLIQTLIAAVLVFGCRYFMNIYRQVWRYGGSEAYIRLIAADSVATVLFVLFQLLPFSFRIPLSQAMFMTVINLLITLLIRHIYQFMYENANRKTWFGRLLQRGLKLAARLELKHLEAARREVAPGKKIKVAIVGAGRIGVMLAEELKKNPRSAYEPCCFIDVDVNKIGREILGIPVFSKEEATQARLDRFPIQEIIFALPEKSPESMQSLYEHYQKTGCKLKVYDYPMKQAEQGGKRQLREFDIEELLFRQQLEFTEEKTLNFYRGKTVLISGGGGSIGSELCRQIAKMNPKKLIVLDVYENTAYDIQQELKIAYGNQLNLAVEIISICDREQLEMVFERHRPQIVLHAAAHKHVPLMERNCVEAVKNNVFGTLNMVEVSEQYGVEKFIMISTDKAVNPTNVMGATKRMCEMIVQSRMGGKTKFSATRFGNVLGSNGSVIPLFKRQIANGGPVTLTDKRIIRYFMTIPEASQLVLTSGAMAKNGELYVLDMGKPVKILELAENMIRLSGLEPYKDIDIIETGLRPGEKLYEELLIKTEDLDKTDNSMIFIERDKPHTGEEILRKLNTLRNAIATCDDEQVKEALKECVDTFHDPGEVNATAIQAEEMRLAENREDVAV
ncbi:MAG: polysaccharide biosynthesis protein [Clostridia bacterium]|nr:polysaccharide biosynthesis protein [Clostridia bacterium]